MSQPQTMFTKRKNRKCNLTVSKSSSPSNGSPDMEQSHLCDITYAGSLSKTSAGRLLHGTGYSVAFQICSNEHRLNVVKYLLR